MTVPEMRPRVVTAAFWCWVVAAVSLVVLGLMLAFSPQPLPVFLRGAGALFTAAGFALGYLAGRTGRGDDAFRRAGFGLALPLVLLLALFCILTQGALWLIPLILTMVGAVLIMRPAAQEWFDLGEQR